MFPSFIFFVSRMLLSSDKQHLQPPDRRNTAFSKFALFVFVHATATITITMHLPTLALFLAAFAAVALGAQSNESICRQKSQRTGSLAAASIRAFCAKTDLVANSLYAVSTLKDWDFLSRASQHADQGFSVTQMQGKYASLNRIGTHAFIAAKSSCPSGSNWVPQKYCLGQMYETCARGDKFGHGRRIYGRGDCQEFNLQARTWYFHFDDVCELEVSADHSGGIGVSLGPEMSRHLLIAPPTLIIRSPTYTCLT
ncbi:hypothetical protein Q7P37_005322 [Cladosporium fusiforme]